VEHRRKARRRAPPSGVTGHNAPATKAVTGAATPNTAAWPNITAVIASGGQIMIGTVAPIRDAAVAHDGKKTLAMLRRRPDEAIPDLLARLEIAIGTAKATGTRVDEINRPNADTSYEL